MIELTAEEAARFTPLRKGVLVERSEEGHYNGILYIPDIARGYDRKAKVIAVGSKATGVKKGDEVYLPGIALTQPDWETGKYALITEDDIGFIYEN